MAVFTNLLIEIRSLPASFRPHIQVVVEDSAEKEMAWITTQGVVAPMQDANPFRNRTYRESIGESMCQATLPRC